jgi:hypothetical protein
MANDALTVKEVQDELHQIRGTMVTLGDLQVLLQTL